MSASIITVDSLSKRYRLGQIGATTLRDSAQRFVDRLRRRVKPQLSVNGSLLSGNKANDQQPTTNNEFWALKDVSFEVQQGEVLGIIGRNGAGKSTLLKILSRITEPTSGRAIIRGRVASLLEVGTGFHPELSGRENIFLNGAILGMKKSEIEYKFDEIVSFAEVERFIDTPVKHYSSGMYVRLAFAVAAHLEPEILIVDEVLAVGDANFQSKCLGKMQEVSKQGRTILFVSHNMAAISNLTSRVLWISNGSVRQSGQPNDVISAYATDGAQNAAEIIYKSLDQAPGNSSVRLLAVRILLDNTVTADVLIDKPIKIEYEYRVLAEVPELVHHIHVRDAYDNIIFISANFPSASVHVDPWFGQKHAPGVYRTSCIIPENFLNDNTYWIDVGFQDSTRNWIVSEKHILSFRVHETGAMKKEYFGHWAGFVRPKLDWRTTQIL